MAGSRAHGPCRDRAAFPLRPSDSPAAQRRHRRVFSDSVDTARSRARDLHSSDGVGAVPISASTRDSSGTLEPALRPDSGLWRHQRAREHRLPGRHDGDTGVARHAPDAAGHPCGVSIPPDRDRDVLRGGGRLARAESTIGRSPRRAAGAHVDAGAREAGCSLGRRRRLHRRRHAGAGGLSALQGLHPPRTASLCSRLFRRGRAVPPDRRARAFLPGRRTQEARGLLADGPVPRQQRGARNGSLRTLSLSLRWKPLCSLLRHERLGALRVPTLLVQSVLGAWCSDPRMPGLWRVGPRLRAAGPFPVERRTRTSARPCTRGHAGGAGGLRRHRRLHLLQHQRSQRVCAVG